MYPGGFTSDVKACVSLLEPNTYWTYPSGFTTVMSVCMFLLELNMQSTEESASAPPHLYPTPIPSKAQQLS